ncbi:hypothetical protein [Selenomonas sp. AE3005]|uniref:hypothetical protein n=1 Tax=Selenomonas sp. AE3005 TaxID=1485543 RepID=UPI0025F7339D|nr:hypothetical protein [Selenomonas sp. AE3005]
MPMETSMNVGIRPVDRPQAPGAAEGVGRRGDGGSSAAFSPKTNVAIQNAVDDMAGVLARIASNQTEAVDKMPADLQKMIQNIMKQAFSLEETLGQGLGSSLESQRFSMDQLSAFSRMLTQMGKLMDKGMSLEVSDTMQTLLTNLKTMVSSENNAALEPVLLTKAAFELLDNKSFAELPKDVQQLLLALQPQGMPPTDIAGESSSMNFLKQLVQYFMPRPAAGSEAAAENAPQGQMTQGQGTPGQAAPGQAMAQGQQAAPGQAGQQAATTPGQAAPGQAMAQGQQAAPGQAGQQAATTPGQTAPGQAGQPPQPGPGVPQPSAGQTAAQPQTAGQGQNLTSQGQPLTGQGQQAAVPGQAQAQPAAPGAPGAPGAQLTGQQMTGQSQAPGQNMTGQTNTAGQAMTGQTANNSQGLPAQNMAQGQRLSAPVNNQAAPYQTDGQGQQTAAAEGRPQQAAMQQAKNQLLSQNMENTPQMMNALRDLGQLLMKEGNLTQKDALLMQSFVNGKEALLSAKESQQLQQLIRLCQANIPATVQQAALQQNIPDLPRLWAFMQLCDMSMTRNMTARQLKKAGKDVAMFVLSMRQSMEGDNSIVPGQRSLNFMLPMYMGEETTYPSYIHVYDENRPDPETGEMKKETWLRLCVLTDNIGAVELTCRVYQENQLDMRLFFSNTESANEFRSQTEALRSSLRDSTLRLKELKIGAVGERRFM